MEHGHNKKMMFGMLAAFIAVILAAILFGKDALVLLVLLCPIMMIAMMFGMNHNHK